MPETMFRVRWPDGTVETCYSPSTVIRDFFVAGRPYALNDFLDAARAGLQAASERVRMRYGSGCSRAMAQLSAIERRAKTLGETNRLDDTAALDDAAAVTVEAFM